jgi:hypothetical protein
VEAIMPVRKIASLLAPVFAALSWGTPASSAVLIDTGAPPPGSSLGWTLAIEQSLYAQFTLTDSTVITAIEALMGGEAQTVTIGIYANNSVPGLDDLPGGTPFLSAKFQDVATPFDAFTWQGVSGLDWSLAPGTYWVGFSGNADPHAIGSIGGGGIMGNAPHPLGPEAYTDPHGTLSRADFYNLALRIDAADPASAVPEPASWLTMILGLGLVGAASRRRRMAFAIRS